ncbi:MAG: hypothetical protein JWM57_1808 [Phycisphaerales bacterium]|nr:hypothetical protein [Phycisphaerales bacterium]
MNATLSTARQAILAEIKRLAAEQSKLEKILAQLGDSGTSASEVSTGKRKYTRRAKPAAGDVQGALKLIEKAGKGGIKAIKLAHEIKKAGGSKPSKIELLATDKVKMTGTGGGSTYVYIG